MPRLSQSTQDKLYTYLTAKMGMYDYTRGWLKGDCPFCGKENKFGIHLEENKSNCFSCGPHGSAFNAVIAHAHLDKYNEVHQLLNLTDNITYFRPRVKQVAKVESLPELPPGYSSILVGDNEIANTARRYLKKRGFNLMTLAFKGFGYCDEGPYFGRIIMPYYREGKLIYFTSRTFLDIGVKVKNPPEEQFGIGKSQLIYNIDSLLVYKRIELVESITNAVTIGDQAIAIGGKSISDYQFNCIIKSPCQEVVIALDPDALDLAYKLAYRLFDFKKVKVVELPENEDVNSIGKKAYKEIRKATPWLTWGMLYNKIQCHKKRNYQAYT